MENTEMMTEVVETAVETAEPVVETVVEAGKDVGKSMLKLGLAIGTGIGVAGTKLVEWGAPKVKAIFRKPKKAKDQELETEEPAEETEE